jgi:chromosomal replication initiator protein
LADLPRLWVTVSSEGNLDQVNNGVTDIQLLGRPIPSKSRTARRRKSAVALRHFTAGPENPLIATTVEAILEQTIANFNPLVLCGPSGSGKSHLALGILGEWKTRQPHEVTLSITAADFAREFHEAIETKMVAEFRTPFRDVSLLVVEDLHNLLKKSAAQQELLLTIDVLVASGMQVVLTSRAIPDDLTGFPPRLKARLVGGLVLSLAIPGVKARTVIIRRLAKLRRMLLSENALACLAEGLAAPVPIMLGALVRLQAAHDFSEKEIDAASVREYLNQHHPGREPSIHDIALLTAEHYSLKLSELRSASRRRTIATPRSVAMYLARKLTGNSLQQIGRYFGGRDHTTVSYGCRQTERRLRTEPAVRQAVQQLTELLVAT